MRPLEPSERHELSERLQSGDRSMVLLEPPGCPLELESHPGHGSTGGVRLPANIPRMLNPAETRKLAVALLQLADHAEYGPDEG